MAASPQATFLGLPREVRDAIYLHSIQSHWASDSALRIIPPPGIDGQLYFWPEHNKWQPISLLSTCHQTRSEIQDLIAKQHKARQIRLELDIKARGYVYTPTWTYLNYALQPQDHLDLHVRLIISSTEAFRRNDGWPRQPGQIFRALLNFLGRFIFKGPSFLDHAPPFETPGPHFIDTLSVHICFDDWYTPDTWPSTVHEIFRMLKALSWLDTAHNYIGKVRASTAYTRDGREVIREREWEVRTGLQARFSALREEDWARTGFYFGQAWLERHSDWSRLEDWKQRHGMRPAQQGR